MKKTLIMVAILMMAFMAWGDVFFTEFADPNNNLNARYIELYNNGSTAVDFTEGTGWLINKIVNGGSTVQTINLTGTIAAEDFYIIAYDYSSGTFLSVYGFAPDQLDAVSNGVAGANGDDSFELVDGSGAVVDIYGVQPHADLTGTVWEYEDGRAERAAGATTGTNPPADADWNTWSDGPGGDVVSTIDAPAGFDPGAWIGTSGNVPPSITNIIQTPDSNIYTTDIVSVSADVTDADGTVSLVQLTWGTATGVYPNTINMSLSSGSTYETDTEIPAQIAGTTVYYVIYAEDNESEPTTSSEQSYAVTEPIALNADFEANTTSIYVGESVDFSDLTTGGSVPYTYSWDFDNDSVIDSSDPNPSFTYNTIGTYTVSLTVTDSGSKASDTETKVDYITVSELPDAPDVFFSEYIEGSSNNKALEIYNNSGAAIDLANFQIWRISNGGDWAEGASNAVQLVGEVADGETWVICNSSAAPEIIAVADSVGSSATYYNGDDAMGLAYLGILIDVVGEEGADPGTGWDVAGVTNATAEHTLVRKATVTTGNTNWATSAGTDDNDSEWIVYPQDTFDYLGSHTTGTNLTDTPEFSVAGGYYDTEQTVEITCSTLGATIYYTLDGSEPDSFSDTYSTPLTISSDTNLKAIAYAFGHQPSIVASANYYILAQLANLALVRATDQQYIMLSGEAVLTFQQSYRNQKYIQDATAGILIDDSSGIITTVYTVGDGITGLKGALTVYGNMLQFVPATDPGAATSSNNEIVPVDVTISDLTTAKNFDTYESMVVKLTGISFVAPTGNFANGTVYSLTDGVNTFDFRTTFYDVDYIGTVVPSETIDLIGILNARFDGDYITARHMADFVTTGSLDVPVNIAISHDGTNVTITWDAVTGANSYYIYASDTPTVDTTPGTHIGQVELSPYTAVNADSKKFYQVTASDDTLPIMSK